jgi:hypothetical protein
MTLIKNLGRHSLPPLRKILSRDSKLQEEVGKWFSDRDVTHIVKLVWLLGFLGKIGFLLWAHLAAPRFRSWCWRFRPLRMKCPGCLQLWHKRGGRSPGLEICYWPFLMRRSFFFFFFLNFAACESVVDAKFAPHAKHTASRTNWLNKRADSKACQSIFPEIKKGECS